MAALTIGQPDAAAVLAQSFTPAEAYVRACEGRQHPPRLRFGLAAFHLLVHRRGLVGLDFADAQFTKSSTSSR